jgi:hypothetical protein
MRALEVKLNGKKICVAGVEVGSVIASVGTARRAGGKRRRAKGVDEHTALTVSGYVETRTSHEHPWWVSADAIPTLGVGDRVTIRVVNIDRADEPREVHCHDKNALERSERKVYQRLRRKYGKRDQRNG